MTFFISVNDRAKESEGNNYVQYQIIIYFISSFLVFLEHSKNLVFTTEHDTVKIATLIEVR